MHPKNWRSLLVISEEFYSVINFKGTFVKNKNCGHVKILMVEFETAMMNPGKMSVSLSNVSAQQHVLRAGVGDGTICIYRFIP